MPALPFDMVFINSIKTKVKCIYAMTGAQECCSLLLCIGRWRW
uniref:Uncharacterized protein n=1 Tax=Arundo donax TaxID=35708 RepID=A0A0A9FGE0_ARUDO